ncbi:MAG: TIGR03936 family radical SAM-associated protein [Anaerolineae bacterium]
MPLSPHAGEAAPVQRLQIVFSVSGPARYVGSLDLTRAWVRAFRRLRVPISYSHGFNPHPRLSVAAPLAVGFGGQRELLEAHLDVAEDPAALRDRLAQQLPDGLTLQRIEELPLASPALAARVSAADYVVSWAYPPSQLAARLESLLAAPSLPYVRRRHGKEVRFDLRPRIQQARLQTRETSTDLLLRLEHSPDGAARPEDVLEALGMSGTDAAIVRLGLVLKGP